MRRELDDVDWETLTTGQSASEKWETFKDQMWRVQSKYIPMRCKSRSRKRQGWLGSEIRNAIKEKQNAFIWFKITGLELDLYHDWSKQRQVKKISQQSKTRRTWLRILNTITRLSFSISGEKTRFGAVWAHLWKWDGRLIKQVFFFNFYTGTVRRITKSWEFLSRMWGRAFTEDPGWSGVNKGTAV